MRTVVILVNQARPEAVRLGTQTAERLQRRGDAAHLLLLPDADRATGQVPAGDLSGADLSGADLAVSLGGDGTFLRLAPLAYAARVPVLGVNFGRLGYLLEVEPGRFEELLDRSLAGEVGLEPRSVLAVTVAGAVSPASGDDRSLPGHPLGEGGGGGTEGGGGRWWVALNEMVVEKTVPGHMVHLSTSIDGKPGPSYKADGVLVATPTGSTAYNLSAGGPVMAPRMRAMILTPVAPHLSVDRSFVLDTDQSVSVAVLAPRPAVLVVDGREVGHLSPGAEVLCRMAPEPLQVVSAGERTFAGMLRKALSFDRDR